MPSMRFRAPQEHGSVLAVPAFLELPQQVLQNRALFRHCPVTIDGTPLGEFRAQARQECLTLAGVPSQEIDTDRPLLVSGHQPELCHPGVWVKHFALRGLANALDAYPLHLIVDNDTIKSNAVRAPVLEPRGPEGVHLVRVPFDHLAGEKPYELCPIQNEACVRSFPERLGQITRTWGFEPLAQRVWPGIIADPAPTLGERFTHARRRIERDWGCENQELPVSRLAGTQAFQRFVRHLVADHERFGACYNQAVQDYRDEHGIATRNHPVPDLAPGELPFWVMDAGRSRRVPFRVDLADPASCVRPRALTLTLFARMALADTFFHGIGGGKYDEVTDRIIQTYFVAEPPAYPVVSATFHLPFQGYSGQAEDVARWRHLARDMHWNPQRYVQGQDETIEEWQRLVAYVPVNRVTRAARAETLERLRSKLRPLLANAMNEVQTNIRSTQVQHRANVILHRRDYAWILYPEEPLRDFLQQFLDPGVFAQAQP